MPEPGERIMYRKPLSLLVLLGIAATSLHAAEAAPIPEPRIKNPLALNGYVATALANPRPLKREDYREQEIEFTLRDGTRVGGLIFYKPGRAPLLIATFGFVADRWSRVPAQLVRRFILKDRLQAHVLILDHPSSFPFHARNGHLSIGGYDEGRMILEVADIVRAGEEASRISSLHLMGVSMGGTGVIHALAEDSRLGRGLFASGITFSAVTDYAAVPVAQLSHYTKKKEGSGPWGKRIRSAGRHLQKKGLDVMLERFRRLSEELSGERLDLRKEEAGRFFHDAFVRRLRFLRESGAVDHPSWNPEIDAGSLEAYVASCDVVDHVVRVTVPLLMVHAYDDPVVAYEHLQRVEFVGRESRNPFLTTVGVQQGGHWGFSAVYTRSWVAGLINRSLEPRSGDGPPGGGPGT